MDNKAANRFWAILLIFILFYLSRAPTQAPASNKINLDLIDADVVFTGEDIFTKSNSMTSEYVRVFKVDGDSMTELGTKSLDMGTLSVEPNQKYKFYFFMNTTNISSSYYVDVQDYTGKAQDSADNVVGQGCPFPDANSRMLFVVTTNSGTTQTNGSNPIDISTDQTRDISIRIKVPSDKCYGTPNDLGKNNIICFGYTPGIFLTMDTSTSSMSLPTTISDYSGTTGLSFSCHSFPPLKDNVYYDMSMVITSGATEPTSDHNVSVYIDDIGVYLDDYGNEQWGYADQDRIELGSPLLKVGGIYII